ncbi:MAG: hypothetical protein L6V81_03340 [Clostridium sp.]|nr:MAG: hypothetical protein L6V81_03340 [Clostridium sp.]
MYSIIAEELAISSTIFLMMLQLAIKSVGEYLNNNLGYEVDIYPQGAMEKNLKKLLMDLVWIII